MAKSVFRPGETKVEDNPDNNQKSVSKQEINDINKKQIHSLADLLSQNYGIFN